MPIQPSEREIRRLVKVYREAITELAETLIGDVDLENPRTLALLRQMFAQLDEVDSRTEAWARRNVAGLYADVLRETHQELSSLGLVTRIAGAAEAFAVINQEAVRALLFDPQTGIGAVLHDAVDQVRNRMRTIRDQAKVLQAWQGTIDEVIARVGILEGRNINAVKDAIVRELISQKSANELVWRGRTRPLGPGNILRNIADLPYVVGPNGYTNRIDRYAEMVARTKTRQAMILARRSKLLQNGHALVMITRNRALEGDACDLYIGRVFALTEKAAKEAGVPHVDLLPNGGTPFHPNCTHGEIGFFPELLGIEFEGEDEGLAAAKEEAGGLDERARAALTPPPSWALGKTWREVQKEFETHGGQANIHSLNPNVDFAQDGGGFQRRRAEIGRRGQRRGRIPA